MALAHELHEALIGAEQGHVLERWERLDPAGRARLERDLARLDLRLLQELRACARRKPPVGSSFAPPPLFPLQRTGAEELHAHEANRLGEAVLRRGEVGFVLVAGGQASRLGYDAPKGVLPVGPVSGRSLFAYHAHRLLALRARFGVRTPWYVMTSPENDPETRRFFEAQGFFGLPPEDVFFFSQDTLPALDEEGRMLFASPASLFLAPNGHGGTMLGLERSGAIEDMHSRGLKTLSYFQVDNPLVRPADPLFLGLHALERAEMSSKVVKKRDASEKVGVIGRIDGQLGCIEYSDLPPDLRLARDATGELAFRAGNIAVHALEVDFLERITSAGLSLPWHVARKAMKVVGEQGEEREVLGFKFETFVFDALAFARGSVILEVERSLEFSPVKNRSGEDSPTSVRRDLCRMYAGWVRAARLPLPEVDAEGNHPVEVDPRFAETQDEFLARRPRRPDVHPTGHLYS